MNILDRFRNLTLTRFLEELETSGFIWIVKRLSGNDTGLTGGHQSGLYLPHVFFKAALPEIYTTEYYNPEAWIDECLFPSENCSIQRLRAVYYNSKYFPEKGLKKKYNEFRLTRWGGKSSPVQDIENTGSICIFAVGRDQDTIQAVVWVASSVEEEDLIENWLGWEVEPGRFQMGSSFDTERAVTGFELPESWYDAFPSGEEIFDLVLQVLPRKDWTKSADALLLKRRDLEFEVFERIESAHVLPRISNGFQGVREFLELSLSISNRRKSRTGASLERNLEAIFRDEELAFKTHANTENNVRPDFLFPSEKAYHDAAFPDTHLNMMAAKTCCKDRWRQVISEADRIETKHLFTLQEGVSSNQLQEMKDKNVILVVPEPRLNSFPVEWRASLFTLNSFVQHIRSVQLNIPGLERWIN